MKYTVSALALLVALSAFASADSYYMKVTGQKSGVIKGGVTQKGREDQSLLEGINHDIVSPRDPQSGLPTGKRMHKPLTVTMAVDKAMPLLYNVLCTNENLTKVVIDDYRPVIKAATGTGAEEKAYTIMLTNANISEMHLVDVPVTVGNKVEYEQKLEISFTYQRIEWTWNDGGISYGDDWEARV